MKTLDIHKFTLTILVVIVAISMTSCADVENVKQCVKDEPSGFFPGLIHGIVVLPAFIISLFVDNVAVYDVNNTGHLYDLGYLIGIGAFSSGAKSSGDKVVKNRKQASAEKAKDVSITETDQSKESE